MKKTAFYLLGFILTLLMSCDGDSNGLVGIETPANIEAPYKKLTKITITNAGTSLEEVYNYTDGKLKEVKTSDNSLVRTLTYSNNQISKIVSNEFLNGKTTTATATLTYNTAKLLSSAAETIQIIENGTTSHFYTQIEYTYTNNRLGKIYKKTFKVTSGGQIPFSESVSEFIYSGENVSSEEQTITDLINNNVTTVKTLTYSGYDSKKSAFYGLPLTYNFYMGNPEALSTNTASQRTITENGTQSSSESYTITYDTDSVFKKTNGTLTYQYSYSVL